MKLTKREYEILSLVALGKSDRQIATELNISDRTVQTHLYRAFSRLGVNNRVSASMLFFRFNNSVGQHMVG